MNLETLQEININNYRCSILIKRIKKSKSTDLHATFQRRTLFWRGLTPSRPSIFFSFFSAVEGGRVYIRDWRDRKSSRTDTKRKPVAPGALKTRPCWFHDHHPQRCPLQAEQCAFAHGPDDLRPSTRPLKKIKNEALWLAHRSQTLKLLICLADFFLNFVTALFMLSVLVVLMWHHIWSVFICSVLPGAASGFTIDPLGYIVCWNLIPQDYFVCLFI